MTVAEKIERAFGGDAEFLVPRPVDPETDVWGIDELDYIEDDEAESDIESYLRRRFGVDAKIINSRGPGGKNLVIKVQGTFNAMIEFSLHYDPSGDSALRRKISRVEMFQYLKMPFVETDLGRFTDVASRAKSIPGVWTTLSTNSSNANLVTQIRNGSIKTVPADQFEARSVRRQSEVGVSYDIEIRAIEEGESTDVVDAKVLTDQIIEEVRPQILKAALNALKSR